MLNSDVFLYLNQSNLWKDELNLISEQIGPVQACVLIFNLEASLPILFFWRLSEPLIPTNHSLPFFITVKETKSLVPEGTVFYSCEVCQAKFVNKWTVKRHMRWHDQTLGKYYMLNLGLSRPTKCLNSTCSSIKTYGQKQ